MLLFGSKDTIEVLAFFRVAGFNLFWLLTVESRRGISPPRSHGTVRESPGGARSLHTALLV